MVILHPLLSPPCSRLENPGRIRDYDVQVNDSGKGVKGHKRSILVDTLALLMAVVVTSAQHTALQVARKIQRTDTFKQRYALRAGIEATISPGVRAFDLRRSR